MELKNFSNIINNTIYLDNAATTRCDSRVVDAMKPYWDNHFGNPSSPHIYGRFANKVIEDCRAVILSSLKGSGHLVFTSGSTESNSLGIYSLLKYVKMRMDKQKVLCLAVEHKSVINSVTYFSSNMDIEVEWLPVTNDGLIDMDIFSQALDSRVGAVIVQLANSETGVIQDLTAVVQASHQFGAKCFTDITQAIGKMEVNLDLLGVDYASFSAHKFYGPKGIGALYAAPGLPISPLVFGGGQEKGVRPGTENVPGIVGLAEAVKISIEEIEENRRFISTIRDQLWNHLSELDEIHWNGESVSILPSHLNITIRNVNAQDLLLRMINIAFSAGSACNTVSNEPSPVLLAMGMTRIEAEQTIRLSIGKFNTPDEIERASKILEKSIQLIRSGN